MTGNWAQHAFVDVENPKSDYRSSITVIDVTSSRYSFNDGNHTSHHLNPLSHWRDHPIVFLQQKHIYANEGALVFQGINFMMVTFYLLKDYEHLAKTMVPMGEQIGLNMEERVVLLRKLTRRFSEEEIHEKFRAA